MLVHVTILHLLFDTKDAIVFSFVYLSVFLCDICIIYICDIYMLLFITSTTIFLI